MQDGERKKIIPTEELNKSDRTLSFVFPYKIVIPVDYPPASPQFFFHWLVNNKRGLRSQGVSKLQVEDSSRADQIEKNKGPCIVSSLSA